MKSSSVCIAILLTICVSSSFGATFSIFFTNPKYPGKCAIKPTLVISPGDKVKDPDQICGQIECQNGQGLAVFLTCDATYDEGCTLGNFIDKNLPYPACCERHSICN